MIRVGVIGATGYSGLELVRLLLDHPQAKVTYVSSRTYAGKNLNEVFPALKGHSSLKCEEFNADHALAAADFFFIALPHGLSGEIVPKLLKPGKKVVDLGSDFRLEDESLYEIWYKKKTTAKKMEPAAVYGLPEMNGDTLKNAVLVANPGCYATAASLALLPLVQRNLIERHGILVDAKSGVSGAGRSLALSSQFCEANENMKAYKVTAHQHTPEIEQTLGKAAGEPVVLNLTPHLMPLNRGILATCYGRLKQKTSTGDLLKLYTEYYREEPFVQVMPEGVYPGVKDVLGSNTCMIGLKVDERITTVIVTSVIDNLTKGAAGQAVQNMNLMCGFEETMGLPRVGLIP